MRYIKSKRITELQNETPYEFFSFYIDNEKYFEYRIFFQTFLSNIALLVCMIQTRI